MSTTYTPEERADRRRRSSEITNDESWMADLRAQGVDVEEFLTVPEGIDGSDRSGSAISKAACSVMSMPQHKEIVERRFSQFMENAYILDEATGDMVLNSLEDENEKRWQKLVEDDSKNYKHESSTRKETEKNREWAKNMALKRAAEAGYKIPQSSSNAQKDRIVSQLTIHTRVKSPPKVSLPVLGEGDFDSVEMPPSTPQDLALPPPPLPHKLPDLVSMISTRCVDGIGEGIAVDGGFEDALETLDSESVIVSCIRYDCGVYLRCSRGSSLVRCQRCNTVSPATPASIDQKSEETVSTYTSTSNSTFSNGEDSSIPWGSGKNNNTRNRESGASLDPVQERSWSQSSNTDYS